jgi:hypothetical protein
LNDLNSKFGERWVDMLWFFAIFIAMLLTLRSFYLRNSFALWRKIPLSVALSGMLLVALLPFFDLLFKYQFSDLSLKFFTGAQADLFWFFFAMLSLSLL